MGSHSAKSRQEPGGVWTVICPGKQHFANLLDSSRPARGLLHAEAVDAAVIQSSTPAWIQALAWPRDSYEEPQPSSRPRSDGLPSGLNSLLERGVKRCSSGRPFLCRAIADLRCCFGNHLREPSCKLSQASRGISGHGFRRSSASNRVCELDLIVSCFRLTSEGFVGSNPTAPTMFLQLDGLFETLIGGPGNHSREPPVHAPGRGKGAQRTGPGETRRPRGRAAH